MSITATQSQFKIVFEGQIEPNRDSAEVRAAFESRFGKTAADKVFSAKRIVLKKDLEHEGALATQQQLRSLGLATKVVGVPQKDRELSLVEDGSGGSDDKSQGESDAKSAADVGVFESRPPPAKSQPMLNKTISPKDIDASYSAKPGRPESVSTGYRIHLAVVSVLMILLPVIYLSIVVGTAYGTYWYTLNQFDLVGYDKSGLGFYAGVISYVVPIVGGGLLTLFLLKPFVAGASARGPQPVRLDENREPSVFHLVDGITNSLGAPMPVEILVDADVNASASLRNGVFSDKLTLTIGMPLFYALSIEQLSGILAHEFGHFAQRFGMRFAAIIHYINYWFYRQAHIDDGWDDMIETWGEADNIIATLSALVAQLGVWLVRLFLIALAHVATMLSRGLSRHMEFDADRYQVELTGSAAYADVAQSVRVLSAGQDMAEKFAAEGLNDGLLPNNIPQIAAEFAHSFDAKKRNAVAAGIQEINSSVFDTHPPDLERIAAANRLDIEGVFKNPQAAFTLLREPQKLGMHVTLQWYRAHGLDVEPRNLMTNDAFRQSLSSQT